MPTATSYVSDSDVLTTKNNKIPRLFSLIAILLSLDEVNKKMCPEF
jgi:hypothetical protein